MVALNYAITQMEATLVIVTVAIFFMLTVARAMVSVTTDLFKSNYFHVLDINECNLGTSGCTQLCNNTNGSYTCYCNSGYILHVDSRTCNGECHYRSIQI